MKVKRFFCALLALCLLIPCFAAVPVSAADEGVELYRQVCPGTWAEVQKVWPSNTTQGWPRPCLVEGQGSVPQVDYYNNRNAQGGLPEGETMCIQIPNLRIPTKGYGEVSLSIQYAYCRTNNDLNMGEIDKFEVYASTDGGETWSDKYAELFQQTMISTGTTSNNLDAVIYLVESKNLVPLVPAGATINALKIRPYGDHASHYGATRFQIVTITGYQQARSGSTATQHEVKQISLSEETMRQIVVQRMYQVLELEWTTDEEMVTYNSSEKTAGESQTMYYKPGWLYRSPTYTRKIWSSYEMFRDSINALGEYTGGKTDADAIGMACNISVSAGIGAVSNARHDTWIHVLAHPDELMILGGIQKDANEDETSRIVAANPEKTIYEGYALTKPGDYVLTNTEASKGGQHTRLVTGEPVVVRSARGNIDPEQSKLILSETGGSVEYFWQAPNGSVVKSTSKDVAGYAEDHPDYKYLYGTACRKDKEYTFAQLYMNNYLPYTLVEYTRGSVNDVWVEVNDLPQADKLTTDGYKVRYASNWPLTIVEVAVTDMETGRRVWDEKTYYDIRTFEKIYSNDDFDYFLENLPKGAYELTVDVTAGPVTEVRGERPVTRAAKLDFAVGGAAIPAAVKALDTAGADGWAVDWLNKAFSRGLLGELNQAGFTKDVTRLQFADMAVRLAEVVTGKEIAPAAADSFADTSETAILKAKAAGISAGYKKDDGSFEFRPDNPITRQEICVMLDHVAEYAAKDGARALRDVADIAEKFVDRAEVADWAKAQVARMTGNMVMGGKATDKGDAITPQANTTLQEAVTLAIKLDNMIK